MSEVEVDDYKIDFSVIEEAHNPSARMVTPN